MRERACRVVPLGPILLVRIVERDYGEPFFRVVEEFDVTADIARLVAGAEPAQPARDLLPGEATVGRNGA